MMLPPIYQTLKNNSAVFAIVGNRIYLHGEAVQDTAKPYIVWQMIAGVPENTMSELPQIDSMAIQIDCYHQSASGILTLAKAVRDAIEPYAHITNMPINERDNETKLYRIAIDIDWWYSR
jgi:hypothetical protein